MNRGIFDKLDQLTKDCIMAEQQGYGCHYGAFIADVEAGRTARRYADGGEPEELPKEIPVAGNQVVSKCIHCGAILTGKQKRFCSDECNKAYNRRVRNDRAREYQSRKAEEKKAKREQKQNGLKCLTCGKQLTGNRSKFCSKACCKAAGREKKNEQMRTYLKKKREEARASRPERKCRWCGETITDLARRIYCSESCYLSAKQKGQSEKRKTKRAEEKA